MTDAERWSVPPALDGERIDRVISLVSGLARSRVNEMISSGAVSVGGRVMTQRSRKVREGDTVALTVSSDVDQVRDPPSIGGDATAELYRDVLDDTPLEVLHADDEVIVVEKPAGLVVHPGAGNAAGTLVQVLCHTFPDLADLEGPGGEGRPGIVHRLDKGTSGLLVVARTERARQSLAGQFAHRTVSRRYQALVRGLLESDAGMIDAPLGRSPRDPTRFSVRAGGREARTRYEVKARFRGTVECTHLALTLETGRTHQIRVHVSAIGHPVVGDARYGGRSGPFRGLLQPERVFLHADTLGFDHPGSGLRMEFSSPLPADLSEVLAGLS
ncbi:MAG: RluA family pseudouridine synthase [Acidimicrobiales bacterium]